MIDDVKIQFLGGSSEIGSLAMVLETNGNRYLFEYGMKPSKPPEFPLPAPPVDYTFLTHCHLDHSGMIPSLCSDRRQKIFTTQITSLISNLLHKDSIKVAKSEGYAPPFRSKDIVEADNCYIPVEPKQKRIIGNDHEICMHSAGHIPGSLMYELTGSRRMLFTGDFNTTNTRLVKGTKPVNCDILFMEATYAGRDHPKKRDELEKEFLDKIDEVVDRDGVAVLPSFSVARSQELAIILKKTSYNIWFDGMGRKVTDLYLKHPKYLRSPENLRKAIHKINIVHSDQNRKKALESEVIITSSGMLDGGPVLGYMYKLRNDSKSAVILTGYQVANTEGNILVQTGRYIHENSNLDVKMNINKFDFSAHASHSQLLRFIKKVNPKKIFCVHGENPEKFAEELRQQGFVADAAYLKDYLVTTI